MLAESIIRVGVPLRDSDMSNKERIELLTDCDSENCKNFFQNIFLIEIDGESVEYHYLIIGSQDKDFIVDKERNISYPIFYPQGGNPLHAQGNYPIPCYLMYDRHIKDMEKVEDFAEKVVLPRLEKTIAYMEYSEEQLRQIAYMVANILANNYEQYIEKERQLGILYIYDHSLSEYYSSHEKYYTKSNYFRITQSKIRPGEQMYLNSDKCIENIIEAKFVEAKTLGSRDNAISTFTNKLEEEVASIYNKYWLWLSSTWEAPRSIYWSKEDWTPGIKIDRKNYEAYLYGAQFLNQITLPISSSILKEMFAPIMNVEAKKNMRSSSFEQIYGVPIVLPLVDENPRQIYKKYEYIMEQDKEKKDADIHLDLIAGIDKTLPKIEDEYRLTLLYYSGDISRGDVHIRMIIEDVVPSVAKGLEKIVRDINKKEISKIQRAFGSSTDKKFYPLQSLPSILGNAYGPGYIWTSLETVFNKKPISINKVYYSTATKLNELANKEEYWGMVNELIFYYGFLTFYNRYNKEILKTGKEVNFMASWENILEKYYAGEIRTEDLKITEELGFVAGLSLKQFSNSYHHVTGNDFVKHRVMKFGSKLTPEMIWKDGLLKCEELAMQRDLKLGINFHSNLSHVLLAILEAEKAGLLDKDKDKFMTAFWSGYLMYKKQKEV